MRIISDYANCPMCGSSELGPQRCRPTSRLNGYTLRTCFHCVSESAWPRKAAGADYYTYLKPAARWEFGEVAEDLERNEVAGDVLDAGCGDGAFVGYLEERDIRCEGIDFNEKDIETARRRGLNCKKLDLRQLPEDRCFSAITAFHVIEHVEKPLALVRSMAERLVDKGCIFLSIPNVERFSLRFMRDEADFPPNHLNRITYAGLTSLAEAAGLEITFFWIEPSDIGWKRASSLSTNAILEWFGVRRWMKSGRFRNILVKACLFVAVQPYVLYRLIACRKKLGYTSLYKMQKIEK